MDIQSVSDRISLLYYSSKWHDLEFCLVDPRTGVFSVFRAHRLILAPCSEVFEALCFGPLAEKLRVNVLDIEPTAFDALLRYIYTDKVDFSSVELASHILSAAKKYLVTSLTMLASQYIALNLSDENCIDVYNLAKVLDEKELMKITFEYLCRRIPFLMQYLISSNLTSDLLLDLINAKQLNCEEITLAYLAQTWALQECQATGLLESPKNVRSVLTENKIFQEIQWKSLRAKDLALLMPGLISEEEIFLMDKHNSLKRSSFPLRLSVVYMMPVSVSEFPDYRQMQRNISENTTIATTVVANKSMYLRSLILIGKSPPCADISLVAASKMANCYSERLMVTIKQNGNMLTSQRFCQEVSYEMPFQLQLSEDVVFQKNISYTIDIMVLSDRNNSLFRPFASKSIKNPVGLSISCEKCELSNFSNTRLSFIAGFLFCY